MITAYKEGSFLKDPGSRGKAAPNPMTDPAAMEGMMGMMKGNMAMMVPQTLIMSWINAFFAGFVISMFCCSLPSPFPPFQHLFGEIGLAFFGSNEWEMGHADFSDCIVKLPFPLTLRFKSMLQSGVMTRDLDVRWVSSLSWYFLNLFGLQSVFIFILGNENGQSPLPLPPLSLVAITHYSCIQPSLISCPLHQSSKSNDA